LSRAFQYDGLRIDPYIPSDWQGFTAVRFFRGKRIDIVVRNPNGVQKGVKRLRFDGEMLDGCLIPESLMNTVNQVIVEMG
jgi:cellobiose phosphorylase